MDSKEYLTNKSFCPIPWTGFMYNYNGDIMNCIRSQTPIGNLKNNSIHEILDANTLTKERMLAQQGGVGCNVCYTLEGDKKGYNMISDRIFYLKELKTVDNALYDSPTNFDLHTIDIRWSNVCNFACVYCMPEYSSKWATELNIITEGPPPNRIQELKELIFNNAQKLQHVYLAGGEPLLMKENLELLTVLKEKNPNVNLRINTNLSKVDTRVFDLICTFPNVHWIVSVETMGAEYEYIRYGGSWDDFVANLTTIQQLGHKISFNMLHFLLNYQSLFGCIEYLQKMGFHNNSFIIGALTFPDYLNIRHLPNNMLQLVEYKLKTWINNKPGFLLEDGLQNMLQHLTNPMVANIDNSILEIAKLDKRRNIDSRQIFTEFYKLVKRR